MKSRPLLPPPGTYGRRQAAARLGVGLTSLDALLRAGRLPHVRIGAGPRAGVRIPIEAVEAFRSGSEQGRAA